MTDWENIASPVSEYLSDLLEQPVDLLLQLTLQKERYDDLSTYEQKVACCDYVSRIINHRTAIIREIDKIVQPIVKDLHSYQNSIDKILEESLTIACSLNASIDEQFRRDFAQSQIRVEQSLNALSPMPGAGTYKNYKPKNINSITEKEWKLSNNAIVSMGDRLVPPANIKNHGITPKEWTTLCNAIFPSAETAESIVLAFNYCKVRKLDVFKRPVHIVPMYNSKLGRNVETIWPGIAEIRTTATRTGLYAGIDETNFGPTISKKFSAKNQRDNVFNCDEITFPEWAQVTVYKLVGNQRYAFVGPRVYWTELFSGIAGARVPNNRWQENPYQMIDKCAEAAALRRAFPEELADVFTAEEMENKNIEDVPEAIQAVTTQSDEGQSSQTQEQPHRNEFDEEKFIKKFLNKLQISETLDQCQSAENIVHNKKEKLSPDNYSMLLSATADKVTEIKALPQSSHEDDVEIDIFQEILDAINDAGQDMSAIQSVQGQYAIQIENLPPSERNAVDDAIAVALDNSVTDAQDIEGDADEQNTDQENSNQETENHDEQN